MNWRVKGVVQKMLSHLPGGRACNDRLQQTLGGLRHFDANIAAKVHHDWIVLMYHMRALGCRPQGLRFMEFGTGWYPTLPFCYSLVGAANVITFDLTRHLDRRLTWRMLAALEHHLPAIAEAGQCPVAEVAAAFRNLRGATALDDLLRRARIDYRAPADAARSGLPAASVDVVFSNSVLEHVPAQAIAALMQESCRVLRPGGLAIHSIACNDHYRHFDRSISPINYLAYSERAWRFWNNSFLFQNRLRPRDFLDLAEQAGLEIVLQIHPPQPALLEQLPRLTIAPEFRRYSAE